MNLAQHQLSSAVDCWVSKAEADRAPPRVARAGAGAVQCRAVPCRAGPAPAPPQGAGLPGLVGLAISKNKMNY